MKRATATGIAVFFLSVGGTLVARPAEAETYKPINDMISARAILAVRAEDRDLGWHRERANRVLAGVRLQFGQPFGDTFGVVFAWEPMVGKLWTSSTPQGGFHGITPVELLLNAWIPMGMARGMVRAGMFVDYPGEGVYPMVRGRYDWGNGAVELTGAWARTQFAVLAYRHRLAPHLLLVADVKAERLPNELSPTTTDVNGVEHSDRRMVNGAAVEGRLAIEWALDGN